VADAVGELGLEADLEPMLSSLFSAMCANFRQLAPIFSQNGVFLVSQCYDPFFA
jgi:hypothetical protein